MKTDTIALKLQSEILDLAETIKRIQSATLPDSIEEGLSVFQRKYLVRVFKDLGETVEDCLGQIHAY